MLSRSDEKKLVDQMKTIFQQFVDADRVNVLELLAQQALNALYLLQALDEHYGDDVDDASCGPVALVSDLNVRTEVRCPNCRYVF